MSQRGIEANPDKIKVIEQIEAPMRVKDVRRLASYVGALSRFISKSAERALPFFKVLKKAGPVKWTPEVVPRPREPLLQYLAATNQLVSAALVA